MLGLYSSFILCIRNENPLFQYSHLSQKYSSRLFCVRCQNLITVPPVQSASFPLKILAASSRAKGKSSVQSESIHRQIQQALPKTTGSSEESWYSWINKKACPLSLIAPLQWQTPSWQRASCPAPAHYSDNICHNSICAQSRSGTCWLVDTWPFFSLSNSPLCQHGPYDFTSKPSSASWHNHSLFVFFSSSSNWGNGEGRRYTPAF